MHSADIDECKTQFLTPCLACSTSYIKFHYNISCCQVLLRSCRHFKKERETFCAWIYILHVEYAFKTSTLKFYNFSTHKRRHPWRVWRVFQKCEGPITQKTLRYKWIMKDFLMSERNVITLQGWDILLTPQISILVSFKNIKNNIYLNPDVYPKGKRWKNMLESSKYLLVPLFNFHFPEQHDGKSGLTVLLYWTAKSLGWATEWHGKEELGFKNSSLYLVPVMKL